MNFQAVLWEFGSAGVGYMFFMIFDENTKNMFAAFNLCYYTFFYITGGVSLILQ